MKPDSKRKRPIEYANGEKEMGRWAYLAGIYRRTLNAWGWESTEATGSS
jgi:hypothetical protein